MVIKNIKKDGTVIMLNNFRSKKIIILSIIMLLIILSIPYIKAEVLTYKYGEQFQNLYKQTNKLT